MTFKWDLIEFIDYIKVNNIEINNLPEGISISTMCSTCKLNTVLNIENIEKYLQLNSDDILTVKMNDDRKRTLIVVKEKPKREKKSIKIKVQKKGNKETNKNCFYNQITVVVRINSGPFEDLNTVPKINMKLFKNGSVQMSGCKSIEGINIALNKLIFKLKEVKAKIENGKIIEKKFIEDLDKITVKNFKIDMINSNYQVNMQIDRAKLYGLLLKKKIKSTYEPCIRACVIIKFVPGIDNELLKEVSIFIFQKGNIIITGARSRNQIIESYNYMNNILLTHSEEIVKKNEKEEEKIIINIYNNLLKEIDIGLINLD
jgi:TATA-box binding protein (TBP) (component of TFIID and TFIIIB)